MMSYGLVSAYFNVDLVCCQLLFRRYSFFQNLQEYFGQVKFDLVFLFAR